MNNIFSKIIQWAREHVDWLLHENISFRLTLILAVILTLLGAPKAAAMIAAALLALWVGILKEGGDEHVDWHDIVADILGVVEAELYVLIL